MVKISSIIALAKSKGLIFKYDESNESFVVMDKKSNMLLAEYADITVHLMTEMAWRKEFNKLKPSSK